MKPKPTTGRKREKKRRKGHPCKSEHRRWAGVIYFCVKDDGTVYGYVENSFSMGFHEQYVRFFPHQTWTKTKSLQSTLNNLRKNNPSCEWFMFRAGTARCPILLDWADYYSKKRSGTLDKFGGRNRRFTVDCDRLESLLSRRFASK